MRQLLLLTALAAGLVAAPAHAATRDCGLTTRIDGVRYQVKETKGTMSCTTVKKVMTRFLRDGKMARPWFCSRSHGADFDWAASCSRGKQVMVRAYAPN
jgi:hypothetical protein